MENKVKNISTEESLPLISIVLPIYNIEKYLDKCMESLLEQTYPNLEILMVDDGSTDSCPLKCDQYSQKNSQIYAFHKLNGGLSDARNYGIERANGEYISFIDPDDYVEKDYIEYLYNLIVKYQTKMSLCQHFVHFDNGSIKKLGKPGDELLDNKECIRRMMYHDIIDTSAWAKLYSRDLFQNVRYPKGKIFEDIGTTYAFMLQCDKIACGYEEKYHYIFHENSIVNGKFKRSKLDLLEMTDKMADDVEKCYPELHAALLRRRVYARLSTLNQMLDEKEFKKEKKEILDFINKYRNDVLNDACTPKRDRIALRLLKMGYPVYKIGWKCYIRCVKG